MKNIFEKWEKSTSSLGNCIGGWLHKRTAGIASQEQSKQIAPLLLAELAVRAVEDAPHFAPQVLNKILNDHFITTEYGPLNAIVNNVIARCAADDTWSVLPVVLQAIHNSKNMTVFLNDPFIGLAEHIMGGPEKFVHISQHFDNHTKEVMLPYCLARDPYNREFISEHWGTPITPEHVWRGIVIDTQGFKDFGNINSLKKLGEQITLSEMFDQLKDSSRLPAEFKALAAAVDSLRTNKPLPNFSDFSWKFGSNPEELYKKWLAVLEIVTPRATPKDQVVLEKLDAITQQCDVSLISLISEFQKTILTEALQTDHNPSRAHRKI